MESTLRYKKRKYTRYELFTEEEEAYIKHHYAIRTDKEMAIYLGRTSHSVRIKRFRMDCKRQEGKKREIVLPEDVFDTQREIEALINFITTIDNAVLIEIAKTRLLYLTS